MTIRKGGDASERSGIGEDERQPVMARLAALWRRSNWVILVTLRRESFMQRLQTSVIEHPYLILHCSATDSAPLALWRLFVSVRSLVQALKSCPAYGALWSSVMPPVETSSHKNILAVLN